MGIINREAYKDSEQLALVNQAFSKPPYQKVQIPIRPSSIFRRSTSKSSPLLETFLQHDAPKRQCNSTAPRLAWHSVNRRLWAHLLLILLAIWRGGEGSFEGSIKNWPGILLLLRGRCQRDRTSLICMRVGFVRRGRGKALLCLMCGWHWTLDLVFDHLRSKVSSRNPIIENTDIGPL